MQALTGGRPGEQVFNVEPELQQAEPLAAQVLLALLQRSDMPMNDATYVAHRAWAFARAFYNARGEQR